MPRTSKSAPSFLPALELLWIARVHYAPGYSLPTHQHEKVSQLFLILAGDGRFVFGKNEIRFDTGRVFFAPPGKRHGFLNDGKKSIWTLEAKFHLNEPRLFGILKNLDRSFYDEEQGFRLLLESMVREGMSGGVHHREIASARLLELLWRLARQGEQETLATKKRSREPKSAPGSERVSALSTAFDPLVRSAVEWIERNLHEPLSLKKIAEHTGFTTRHVSERFRQVTGETVLDWLQRRRVEETKRLMLESDAAIEVVALRSGFETVHHFSRIFKEREGLPPGKWREREKSGINKGVAWEGFDTTRHK